MNSFVMGRPAIVFLGLFIFGFVLRAACFAEGIHLNSGRLVEGRIIEERPGYVKLDCGGSEVLYERQYIKSVERGLSGQAQDCLKKGFAYAAEFKIDEAEREWKHGLEVNPSDRELQGAIALIKDWRDGLLAKVYVESFCKGALAFLNEDYAAAEKDFSAALEVKPNDADSLYNLGAVYNSAGKHEQAVNLLSKSLQLRPDDPGAYEIIGAAYYAKGEYSLAKANWLIAEKLFSKAMDEKSASEIRKFLEGLSSF